MLVEAYGEHALGKSQCFEWFKKFKSGDFDVKNEEWKTPKKFEDSELQALLDEDDAQTQQQFADQCDTRSRLYTFEIHGKDPEDGKMDFTWTEWKTAGKPKNHLRNAARQAAAYKRKSFFHWNSIVTGDEKWIYFENPKRKRSWVTPGEPSTSTARPNRYGRKIMLCVWWDQKGVIYYELLKSGETVNTKRYRQQIINLNQVLCEKWSKYQKRRHKVILLHIASYTAKLVKETIEAFGWEILSHAAYSQDLAPSDYHLFASMGRTCSALHFLRRCTKMARWLVWLKRATIFLAWHPQIVKQVEKMYSCRWAILRIKYFLSFSCNKRVFSIKKFRFHIYIPGIT